MCTRWVGLVVLAPLVSARATMPTGPSVTMLPGSGKSFEQFQATTPAVGNEWSSRRARPRARP